ncbi:MAG: peptidoglycan-binding protein [Candidatus Omnitrophica bacterium]|nr:peptidoglycan-binding protein [Candidatus Omnitrophota bacterium]
MNFLVRTLCVVALAGALAGCASTRQAGNVNQLQIRVAQLEREVAAKDETIAVLQQRVSQPSGRSSRPSSGGGAGKGGIIRVPVSARDVQTALQRAGYYSGNIDGKIGGQTIEAIKKFQRDNNLKADGIVGANTWTKLQSAPTPGVAADSAAETATAE